MSVDVPFGRKKFPELRKVTLTTPPAALVMTPDITRMHVERERERDYRVVDEEEEGGD